MKHISLYIFSFLLSLLVGSSAFAEKRVALVIGNSAYKNISSLDNPVKDARLMAKVLEAQGFEVILGLDLEYRAMKRLIRRYTKKLRSSGRDTIGFLFYAGHGLQVAGTNYLVPVKAEIETEGDVDIEAISASSLLFGVREARNRLNIIVLDACRNNPYRSLFRSASRGLLQMNAPMGSLIAFSTSPGDVAADGSGQNSPFTKALAKSLQIPGLTIERVFKQARRKVYKVSNKQQLPWINSSVLGDFYPAGQTGKALDRITKRDTEDSSKFDAMQKRMARLEARLKRQAAIRQRKDTGKITLLPSSGIKASLVGVWKGELMEPSRKRYNAEIKFKNNQKGLVNYPSFPCGGNLQRISLDEFLFQEKITQGRGCFRNGFVRLKQKGNRLEFKWYRKLNGRVQASGTLTRR